MTAEAHILTIDLGTSGPKAAVVTSSGRVVGSARASVRTHLRPGGGAEQDPEAVWDATLSSSRQALARAEVAPSSFAAVVASSQYSSIVPVDANGVAVADMVLWLDQRGAPKRLKRIDGYPRGADSPVAKLRWLQIHGLPPIDAAMSLNHMRWIRYARPEIEARTHTYLEPVDYLTARFTGRIAANQCSAFMMLLTDNRTLGTTRWHPTLVDQSLVDPAKLPELVAVGSEVGPLRAEVAEALGLPPSTPVLAGINDTQAGAIAAGAFRGTHAGLSLGTSSVITTHMARKKTNPVSSLFTMPSPVGGTHLLSAENGVAGVAVDHFLDQLVHPDDPFQTPVTTEDRYQAFNDAAAEAGIGAGGVLFLPWLRGSLAPTADPRLRAGFLNIGLDTTRSDLARAVLEGVALNLRWLRRPVETFVRRPLSHFVFYGGGAQSDIWSQVMADVLASPVHQLEDPSFANNVGAALFAGEHLGLADSAEAADQVPVRRVYEPDPSTATRYDELSGVFVEAFKKTRRLFRPTGTRR